MVPRARAAAESGFASKLRKVLSFSVTHRLVTPEASDDLVAIKCNLCEDTPLNPPGARRKTYSCEENCPTGALVRVDPIEYFSEIGRDAGVCVSRSDSRRRSKHSQERSTCARVAHRRSA